MLRSAYLVLQVNLLAVYYLFDFFFLDGFALELCLLLCLVVVIVCLMS